MSTETNAEKKNSTKTKAELEAENAALLAELEALKTKNYAAATAAVAEATGPKMVKIKIPRTKKDEEDVFVSVNNYTCIVKRGVEVEVPDFVYEVLQHQEEMLEKIMLFEDAVKDKNK